MTNRELIKYAANRLLRHRVKQAGIKLPKLPISGSNLILPGVGAGVSSLATLIGMRGTKASLKDKIKRLIRNAALGATVGTGLELGRVGITGLMSPKEEIDGGAIVDSNFVDE